MRAGGTASTPTVFAQGIGMFPVAKPPKTCNGSAKAIGIRCAKRSQLCKCWGLVVQDQSESGAPSAASCASVGGWVLHVVVCTIVWRHWAQLLAMSGPMGALPHSGTFSFTLFGWLLRLQTPVRLCLAHRSGRFVARMGASPQLAMFSSTPVGCAWRTDPAAVFLGALGPEA